MQNAMFQSPAPTHSYAQLRTATHEPPPGLLTGPSHAAPAAAANEEERRSVEAQRVEHRVPKSSERKRRESSTHNLQDRVAASLVESGDLGVRHAEDLLDKLCA